MEFIVIRRSPEIEFPNFDQSVTIKDFSLYDLILPENVVGYIYTDRRVLKFTKFETLNDVYIIHNVPITFKFKLNGKKISNITYKYETEYNIHFTVSVINNIPPTIPKHDELYRFNKLDIVCLQIDLPDDVVGYVYRIPMRNIFDDSENVYDIDNKICAFRSNMDILKANIEDDSFVFLTYKTMNGENINRINYKFTNI